MPGTFGTGLFGTGLFAENTVEGAAADPQPSTSRFKKNNPGCHCCCSCVTVCGGDTPCTWTLTLSDGQIVTATKITGSSASHAVWVGTFSEITYLGCTYNSAYVYFNQASTYTLRILLYHSGGSQSILWESIPVGLPFDCETPYTAPYLTAGGSCTPSSTPGSVTAEPGSFVECESATHCDSCAQSPTQIQIDIALVADSVFCTTCEDFNQSFLLDYVSDCCWEYEFPAGFATCSGGIVWTKLRACLAIGGAAHSWTVSVLRDVDGVGSGLSESPSVSYWSGYIAHTSLPVECLTDRELSIFSYPDAPSTTDSLLCKFTQIFPVVVATMHLTPIL